MCAVGGGYIQSTLKPYIQAFYVTPGRISSLDDKELISRHFTVAKFATITCNLNENQALQLDIASFAGKQSGIFVASPL